MARSAPDYKKPDNGWAYSHYMNASDHQKLIDNSKAWHETTNQAERDRLHAESEAIRGKYGYSGGADGSGHTQTGQMMKGTGFAESKLVPIKEGYWGGGHRGGGSYSGGGAYRPQVDPYEEARRQAEAERQRQEEARRREEEERRRMIEEMNRLKQQQAINAIQGAYDKNMAAFNRAQEGLAPGFQDARNRAAAQNVLAGRRFGEFASASGLTSGTNAQAELSRQNQLQTSLTGIDQQEAGALADLNLQKTQATTDYNQAIAQAQAQGDYQLAQQLYEEKVRNDAAARQQAQLDIQNNLRQAQFEAQQKQQAWENEQRLYLQQQEADRIAREEAWRQGQFDYQKEQDQWAKDKYQNGIALDLAQQYAKNTGDYSVLQQFGYPAGSPAAPSNLVNYNPGATPKPERLINYFDEPQPQPENLPYTPPDNGYRPDVQDMGSVLNLGSGPISYPHLETMVESGMVDTFTGPDGKLQVRWKTGQGPGSIVPQPPSLRTFF